MYRLSQEKTLNKLFVSQYTRLLYRDWELDKLDTISVRISRFQVVPFFVPQDMNTSFGLNSLSRRRKRVGDY
jgi:hypothetical protein